MLPLSYSWHVNTQITGVSAKFHSYLPAPNQAIPYQGSPTCMSWQVNSPPSVFPKEHRPHLPCSGRETTHRTGCTNLLWAGRGWPKWRWFSLWRPAWSCRDQTCRQWSRRRAGLRERKERQHHSLLQGLFVSVVDESRHRAHHCSCTEGSFSFTPLTGG